MLKHSSAYFYYVKILDCNIFKLSIPLTKSVYILKGLNMLYFRLHCKILEVKAPLQHNGMANGHASSRDEDTIIISDSDDSDISPAQNG